MLSWLRVTLTLYLLTVLAALVILTDIPGSVPETVGVLAVPLKSLGTSYIGSMFTVLAISVLWSVGINSGSMVNGIVRPFWLENQVENI